MKEKVQLFIYGNLIITGCKIFSGGGYSEIISGATPNNYDLSEAVILHGNVTVEKVSTQGVIATTGDIIESEVYDG